MRKILGYAAMFLGVFLMMGAVGTSDYESVKVAAGEMEVANITPFLYIIIMAVVGLLTSLFGLAVVFPPEDDSDA